MIDGASPLSDALLDDRAQRRRVGGGELYEPDRLAGRVELGNPPGKRRRLVGTATDNVPYPLARGEQDHLFAASGDATIEQGAAAMRRPDEASQQTSRK